MKEPMKYTSGKGAMFAQLDLSRFCPIVIVILIVVVAVVLNVNAVQAAVDRIYAICSSAFGWLFIAANLAALSFSIWAIFGRCRNVRLGGADAKPEYGNLSWVAMMFTTSCSAGLLVFGFIEPIIYVSSDVPLHQMPFSPQAFENAQMYAHYHWGLNAWSLYVPASIAIGFAIYNEGSNQVAMSAACQPLLREASGKGIGAVLIDIFSTFGAVVAPVTSMGLGMPLLTILVQEVFGVPDDYVPALQICILVVWVAMFGISVYLGLQKGINNLSRMNAVLAFVFMAFVGILAGLFYIFKAEINTLGLYVSNFVRMATNTDPYSSSTFVERWTVWYWAWLIVYMPLMGVFNAKISKGRTLREIAIGQMIFCSLGCWIAMMTLGNYTIELQQSGTLDVAVILADGSQAEAIMAIIKTMPFSTICMLVVIVLCFLFMATTVGSSSLVAAETTTKHDNPSAEAPRWSRVMWAAISCLISFALLQVGGFGAVQVLAILVGLPLAILMFMVISSALVMLRRPEGE